MVLSRELPAKMSTAVDHPRFEQIYWMDTHQCLHPRLICDQGSVVIVGAYFRKATEGASHADEFSMLNR